MTCRVPNLKLYFASFVILRAVVCIKNCGLIQGRESFLGPSHDDGGLAYSCVSNEYELHVMLLILVNQWFCLYHFFDYFRLFLIILIKFTLVYLIL